MRLRVSQHEGSAAVDLTGQVAMVTGATGAMGRLIAAELARLGATVVIVSRDTSGGEQIRRQIADELGADRIEVLAGELSARTEVRRIAGEFTARHPCLHLLINNAGATFPRRTVNTDGIEMNVAVNHLAAFGLTTLLLDQLRAGTPARVINVVSETMSNPRPGSIGRPRPVTLDAGDLDDLRLVNGPTRFAVLEAYARAKMLTTMTGYLLAERLQDTGVTVNAIHPGLVATGIHTNAVPPIMKPLLSLMKRRMLTPAEGAAAILRLATAPELAAVTGRYFIRDTEHRSPQVSYDHNLQQRVWDASDSAFAITDRASTRPAPAAADGSCAGKHR